MNRYQWVLLSLGMLCGHDAVAQKAGTIGDLVSKCRAVVRSVDGEGITTQQSVDGAYCMGFIQADGVNQALRDDGRAYCPPMGVVIGQRAKILVAWADKHPEHLHLPDLAGLQRSMMEAFPCD